jgi:hypothetical protein
MGDGPDEFYHLRWTRCAQDDNCSCGSRVAGGGLAIMNSARKSSQRVVCSHFQHPGPRKDWAQLKRSLECPAGLFPRRSIKQAECRSVARLACRHDLKAVYEKAIGHARQHGAPLLRRGTTDQRDGPARPRARATGRGRSRRLRAVWQSAELSAELKATMLEAFRDELT